jgi:hypothetical protein
MRLIDFPGKEGRLSTTRVDKNNPESAAAIHVTLYTRDKTEPMKCKVGLKEACGLDFVAAPLDLERLVSLSAVEGEIIFTDLGKEQVGQRIRGTYWGTDKKHFTVKGEFDLKVVKVAKR